MLVFKPYYLHFDNQFHKGLLIWRKTFYSTFNDLESYFSNPIFFIYFH